MPRKKPLALLSVTSVSRHISQAPVPAKGSNSTQPLLCGFKNLIYTPFLSLILLSHPHPNLMLFSLRASAWHPCIVLSGLWVKVEEGDRCYSERTHSGDAANTNKRNSENRPNMRSHSISACAPTSTLNNSAPLLVITENQRAQPAIFNHAAESYIFHVSVQLGNAV